MPKTYFCTECKKNHRCGKIWEDHKRFKKIKQEDNVPRKRVVDCDWDFLPEIAQRQIMSYLRKIDWDRKNNGSRKKEMYVHEINRVILHEGNGIIIKI